MGLFFYMNHKIDLNSGVKILQNAFLTSLFVFIGCVPPLSPILSSDDSLLRKPIPEGWAQQKEVLAKWGTTLPTVMTQIPDTTMKVQYWETYHTTEKGMRLPIKQATISFTRASPVSITRTDLHFVNIAYIYSLKNHEIDHYLLVSVVKNVECKPTGFPQLTSQDVLRYKILQVYGTPHEYNGVWHFYRDQQTEMGIQEVNNMHLIVEQKSLVLKNHLQKAVQDMYSDEGIEHHKQKKLKDVDL